ncbi:MAG: DUF3987 domain-containing protein [Rhodomicrobium sp.]
MSVNSQPRLLIGDEIDLHCNDGSVSPNKTVCTLHPGGCFEVASLPGVPLPSERAIFKCDRSPQSVERGLKELVTRLAWLRVDNVEAAGVIKARMDQLRDLGAKIANGDPEVDERFLESLELLASQETESAKAAEAPAAPAEAQQGKPSIPSPAPDKSKCGRSVDDPDAADAFLGILRPNRPSVVVLLPVDRKSGPIAKYVYRMPRVHLDLFYAFRDYFKGGGQSEWGVHYHVNPAYLNDPRIVMRDGSWGPAEPAKASKATTERIEFAHDDIDLDKNKNGITYDWNDPAVCGERIRYGWRILERIYELHGIWPAIVNFTGGGITPLYRLKTPLVLMDVRAFPAPGTKEFDALSEDDRAYIQMLHEFRAAEIDSVERINRALLAAVAQAAPELDLDYGTTDICHVFRLPGSINYPNETKRARGRVPVRAHTPYCAKPGEMGFEGYALQDFAGLVEAHKEAVERTRDTVPRAKGEIDAAWIASDLERAREALKHVDANSSQEIEAHGQPLKLNSREIWLKIGMALHEHTNGSEEGRAVWNEWAARCPDKFNDEGCGKWDSFGNGGGPRTGIGTLFDIAKQCGCPTNLLEPQYPVDPLEAISGFEGAQKINFDAQEQVQEEAKARAKAQAKGKANADTGTGAGGNASAEADSGHGEQQPNPEWPEYYPLNSNIPRLPYPIEALPKRMRLACEEINYSAQVPQEMPPISAHAAVSLAAQAYVNVARDETLIGPVSIYSLIEAESGERKSQIDRLIVSVIRDFQKERAIQEKQRQADAIRQAELNFDPMSFPQVPATALPEGNGFIEWIDHVVSETEKNPYYPESSEVCETIAGLEQLGTADALQACRTLYERLKEMTGVQITPIKKRVEKVISAARREEKERGKALGLARMSIQTEVNRYPILLRSAGSTEGLLDGMSQWPSCGQIEAEAGAAFGGYAMRPETIMGHLAILNKFWDGVDYRKDLAEDSREVRDARYTCAFQVQAATLRELCQKNGALLRGIGFWARFLFARPQSTQGSRLYRKPITGQPSLKAFQARLRALLEYDARINDLGGLTLETIELSPEAHEAWIVHFNGIETDLRPDGEFSDIKDIANKAADNIARIAALYHVFDFDLNPEAKTGEDGRPIYSSAKISVEHLEAAAKVVRWHLNEARRFFAEFSPPQDVQEALEGFEWLVRECKKKQVNSVPWLDLLRKVNPRTLRNAKTLRNALTKLRDCGYLKVGADHVIIVRPELLK